MPYYRSRRRTRTFRRKGSKWSSRFRSRRPKISKTVKRYVKREIHRNIENKIQDVQITDAAIDYQIDGGDVRNLIPLLSQGTNEETRIGNNVRVRSLKVKLHITAFNQGASTSPTYFDVYIFKYKPSNYGGGPPDNVDMLAFLQDGSSAKAYVGTALDGLRKLNEEQFTSCVKRRIQLFNPQNSTAQLALAAGRPSTTLYFDLTKHVKKLLRFDDSAQSVQNDNLYIAIGATQTDDSVITTVNLGKYDVLVEMSYEDA